MWRTYSMMIMSILMSISAGSFASSSREIYDGNYKCDAKEGYIAVITKNGRIQANLNNDRINAQAALKNGTVSVTALINGTPIAYRLYMGRSLKSPMYKNTGKRWGFHLENKRNLHYWNGYVTDDDFRLLKHKATIVVYIVDEYFELHKQITTLISMTLLCWTE